MSAPLCGASCNERAPETAPVHIMAASSEQPARHAPPRWRRRHASTACSRARYSALAAAHIVFHFRSCQLRIWAAHCKSRSLLSRRSCTQGKHADLIPGLPLAFNRLLCRPQQKPAGRSTQEGYTFIAHLLQRACVGLTCISLGFSRIAGSRRGSSADLSGASAAHHVRTACNIQHSFNDLHGLPLGHFIS